MMSIKRNAVRAIALAFLTLACTAQVASGETTHRFIKQMDLPVGGAQPLGVDQQGNIVVWAQDAVHKFSPNGAPVNFSGLGTNTIDGKGGSNCPATPADCDQIPWNGFGTAVLYTGRVPADMNQSTKGPSAGYIYVAATNEVAPGDRVSQTFVFDGAGVYRGVIDTTQPTPKNSAEGIPHSVSVSPNGTLVLAYDALENEGHGDGRHADKYQAVDADPAHDAFVGQIRRDDFFSGTSFGSGAIADDTVVYVGREGIPRWSLYDAASFSSTEEVTPAVNLDPGGCTCPAAGPWLDGGANARWVSINPKNHHAFLFDEGAATIEEWSSITEKVGPAFGTPETLGGAGGPMAFDTSGIASTDGRMYIGRAGGVAVFSPPVPIAIFEDLQASVGHNTASVSATVNLNHGPKVTVCEIQWGERYPEQPVYYGQSIPCSPAAPYTDEFTAVSGTIPSLETERDYSVRFVVKTNNGINRSAGLPVRPAAVLDLETGPATNVGRTSATLTGSLDPDGIETSYWFEYGSSTEYRQKTAVQLAGAGSGPVPPVELQNLQSGRRYHYRLVAQNELGTTAGGDMTFVAAATPAISGVRPSNVAETSATLHARIDTGGYPTTYHFEYGPSTGYGSIAPAKDTDIGSSDTSIAVKAELSDLQPGVTYHFRVVASNQWGTTVTEDSTFDFYPQDCPNAHVRQMTGSSYLPDCRAYELVSPENAGGVQLFTGDIYRDFLVYTYNPFFPQHIRNEAPNSGYASSPPRFGFIGGVGAINGTNPPNSLYDMYTSTRTMSGWVTRYWGLEGNQADFVGGQRCSLTMDVCTDYDNPPILGLPSPPGFTAGSNAPYVWDAEGNSLGRWPTNLDEIEHGEDYEGRDRPSPDFSHYVFSSRNIVFAPGGITTAPGSAYDNDIAADTVTVISELPNGEPIPEGMEDEPIRIPQVSRDGSHILMTTPAPGGVNLYMRADNAVTYDISQGAPVRLIGMTDDGSKVLFITRAHMTPEDTDIIFSQDVFEWREDTGQITLVSQGNGAGNSNECNPPPPAFLCTVTPIGTQPLFHEQEKVETDDLIASENGDVYFISPEQLDPENPGVFNENNLYVYRNGAVQYVATLDPGTMINRLQISPDGSHAAFVTAARLTSYDNNGWKQMYTFEPETGAIRCVSCNPDGQPPSNVRPPEQPGASGPRGLPSADVTASQNGRFMSDDGRTAFATSEALVEADTNGLVDVYEFVGGRPHLITSGTGKLDHVPGSLLIPAEYIGLEGISRDGMDIYFSTFETLAPHEDLNGEFLKFYDARTAGGFPPEAVRLPCVAADECHGPENPAPSEANIGTSAQLGAAAQAPAAKKKKKKRKGKRKRAKRRHKGQKQRAGRQ